MREKASEVSEDFLGATSNAIHMHTYTVYMASSGLGEVGVIRSGEGLRKVRAGRRRSKQMQKKPPPLSRTSFQKKERDPRKLCSSSDGEKGRGTRLGWREKCLRM